MRSLPESQLENKENPLSVSYARYYFFQTIFDLKPEVLRESLRPVRRLCWDIYSDSLREYEDTGSIDLFRIPSVKQGLDAWGKRHHLDADWCYLWVLRRFEENFYSIPDDISDGVIIPIEALEDVIAPPKGLPYYYPALQTRTAYLKDCEKRVKKVVERHPLLKLGEVLRRRRFIDSILERLEKNYCQKVENKYKEQRWLRVKPRPSLIRHIEWAVRHQVMEWTLAKVAEKERVEESTVQRAVVKILNLIGLKKRPDSKPGRVRGRKDSHSAQITRRLGR